MNRLLSTVLKRLAFVNLRQFRLRARLQRWRGEPALPLGEMTVARKTLWFAVYAGAVAASSVTILRTLFHISRADDTASHVLLVPAISIALIYRIRHSVFENVASAWLDGTLVILAGLALMTVGVKGSIGAADTSFQLTVAGLVVMWIGGFLLVYGRDAFRGAIFPLFFLVLMVPIPATPLNGAIALLKEGSAEATAALFSATGTTFHREAFTFFLPKFTIEVADQCSGIRSSLALMITALVAGHVFLRTPWKKALLVAAIVPVAIFKNAVRIVSLSLLATYVNPGFLVGRLHHDGGIVFFILGLTLLAPVLAVLSRSDSLPGSAEPRKPLSPQTSPKI